MNPGEVNSGEVNSSGLNPSDASLEGVVVVDKPEGWTSHDVVGKMRGIAGTRRVGHLGTLDPIATGVLPVMVGQVTRLAQFWDRSEKVYEAVVRFGFSTSTYDREGEPVGEICEPLIDAGLLEICLSGMRGERLQTPPPVSAKKINGVPAYKLARKNIPVELAPVPVTIFELSLVGVEGARARLRVRCSGGTYVRTIAQELGLAMGCGAHIEELRRTQSGPFGIEQVWSLDKLQNLKEAGRLAEAFVKPADLLPQFPTVFVDELATAQIRQGRDFQVSPFRTHPGSEHVKAVGRNGELVAIGRIALPHVYHPVVVMNARS